MADRLDIVETLYRFDEPLLFVARVGMLQALYLKVDETDHGHEFLSCYIDSQHIDALRDGRISIRGVYESQNDLTVVWTDFEYRVSSFDAYGRTSPEIVARLPEPGVGILPRMGECPDVLQEKDALLSVYFKGAGLERDRIAYSTLMNLLGKVQRFARTRIAPPEFRGLRTSTFDFTVGDPALGSLMISIKDPEFNLSKLQRGEKRRNVTPDLLAEGVRHQRDELFDDIEGLYRVRRSTASSHSDAYYWLKDLLPTETSPHDSVMFSTGAAGGLRTVSISTAKAEQFRDVFESDDWRTATRTGLITEINSNSFSCLLRAPSFRITTCIFDGETFESLRGDRNFKIGSTMQVTGDFLSRPRRDKMLVNRVDRLEDNTST